MDSDLGRLIRTLNEKCEFCSSPMQLRARKIIQVERGTDVQTEEKYKVCSKCGEEVVIRLRDKKERVVRVDKTAFVPEKKEERNGHNKSAGFGKTDAYSSGGSFRPSYRRGNKNLSK